MAPKLGRESLDPNKASASTPKAGRGEGEGDAPATATIVALFAEVFSRADSHSELLTRLVISSQVNLVNQSAGVDYVEVELPGGGQGWIRKADITTNPPSLLNNWANEDKSARVAVITTLGQKVLGHAERFIGVPYLWGGCSPFGIDCSGLVQVCYKLEGLQLLRDADLQFADKRFCKIEEDASLDKAKFAAGDLLVFGSNGSITHIGIASGDGRFLHSSGRQRNFGTYFDRCSDPSWVEKYMGAVRLSATADLSIESA
jgi:cell wall-associated NlpC family hydrolase